MQHPAVHLIEGYSNCSLPPAEMLRVGDHIAECATCRADVESLAARAPSPQDLEAFLARDFAEHLSEQEIADAARGVALRPSAQQHLEHCAQCRAEWNDLHSFYEPSAEPVAVFEPPPRSSIRKFVWFILIVILLGYIGMRSLPRVLHRVKAKKPIVFARITDGDRQIGLDEDGNLSGQEPMPSQYASMLASVLHLRAMPTGATDDMGASAPVTANAGFDAVSPRNENTLAHPTFHWNPEPEATSYIVEIYDQNSQLVATSPSTKETQWTFPSALNPGHSYFWEVKATSPHGIAVAPDPMIAKAMFSTLTFEASASIETARREFNGDPLLLAVLYANAGMRSEARAQLHTLEQENPGSTLVHGLANSLP